MRVLVIVVIYKMALTECQTVQGLLQNFARQPELHDSVSVLIWDNSPTPITNHQLFSSFIYKHSQENLGVSGAYNRAMKIAGAMGCEWLLLLDQDTAIPVDFLPKMMKLGNRLLNQTRIAAIAPFLMDGDRILSPLKAEFKRFRPLQQLVEGIIPGHVSAANSGTLMRIDALRKIGGFNEDFWLDYSDVVVFHLLHERGMQIYIAGDLVLQHKMTIIDFKDSMSPERYANLLAAEGAYWDTYRSVPGRALHTLRLIERAIRQKRRFANSAFAKITFACFCRRLFLSKRHRFRWWKRQSFQRNMPR